MTWGAGVDPLVLSTKSNSAPPPPPGTRAIKGRSYRKQPLTLKPALSKWELQDTVRKLLPNTRLGSCNHTVAVQHDWIDIKRKGSRAWFSGVSQCGNVWGCPICAERISRERQTELAAGVGLAIEAHHGVLMATYTIRHGLTDDLKTLRQRFSQALAAMKSTRAYGRVMKAIGHLGDVRAVEVTHGAHGWHPHTHTLILTHRPLDARQQLRLRRQLFCLWYRACLKVGLPAPVYRAKDKHYIGLDLQGARHATDYVSKWGFAHELVGAQYKSGRASGRTPWELLSAASGGDTQAAVLWMDFVVAFKGVAQLYWSKGLRKKLGLGEQLTDQQLLDLEPADTEKVGELDLDTWILICGAGLRGQVLQVAVSDPGSLEARFAAIRQLAETERIDPADRGWRKRIRWDSIRGYWL